MADKQNSTRRNRFQNVASKRVQKVLNDLDSLSKCANKSSYQYDESDVSKMMRAIREKVKYLELVFHQKGEHKKDEFKF